MTAAFILLAHDHLAEAGAFAHALAKGGRRVAVHIDAKAPADAVAAFDDAVSGDEIIRLDRRDCAWGMFSLVEATLDGLAALAALDGFSHVALVSGSDLPLRPLADFDGFLGDHKGVDLIEAVELSEKRWVMDGLSDERFRLYHPFEWRRRRGLFDINVKVQKFLKIKRRLPARLTPALGSQWWALSRETVEAILSDPQLPALKKFYRWTWIPDESFFQTLARRHGASRINQGPTLSRFDDRGMPFVFYDDHAQLLSRSDHFFARKIHPRAMRLRETCLARAHDPAQSSAFAALAPEDAFRQARRSRTHGREHLISPSRVRRLKGEAQHSSPFPYAVIGGVGRETADLISRELSRRGDVICHGRLFAPGETPFHNGAWVAAGCVPASPQARDFWPDQFVINLARGAAGAGGGAVAFCLAAEDRDAIGRYVAADPGARVIWYRGAWAIDLYRSAGLMDGDEAAERGREAAVAERGMLADFRKEGAALTVRPASSLIDDPVGATAEMLTRANARPSAREIRPPVFAPEGWDRARPFLRALQRAGVEIEAGLLSEKDGS